MDAKETYRIFAKVYDKYTYGFKKDIPLYQEYSKNCSEILEIGCGSGRILKELTKTNTIVTGIDISPEMLSLAREKLKNEIENRQIELFEYDFLNDPIECKYDLALITWYTFNYILNKPILFLKNVSLSLKKDSLIILDMFYPEPYKHPEINNKWITKEIATENLKYTIQDKRTVKNKIEKRIQIIKQDEETYSITTNRMFYSKIEIQEILFESGYSDIFFIENYDITTIHKLNKKEKTNFEYICIGKNAPSVV
jgi:SAM-dependent methyltransferase